MAHENPNMIVNDGGDFILPEERRIQDLEGWLQQNGLRNNNEEPTLDQQEAQISFAEARRYQERVLDEIFSTEQGEQTSALAAASSADHRRLLLDSLNSLLEIDLSCSTRVVRAPLRPLAETCDTILALVSSRHYYNPQELPSVFALSLTEYHHDLVLFFVDIVLGKQRAADIPSDQVVDCLQMAHFLQCATVVEDMVEILLDSVDTANCLSISQLADQLNIPRLLERALSHMMDTIAETLEQESTWGDLSPELQDRILTIKTTIQSSLHIRSRLYFSSLDEYIAIFAERVQYYRERLEDAREQQMQARPHTPCWRDAQMKIERQAKKLNTLELALQEQKKLFAQKRWTIERPC